MATGRMPIYTASEIFVSLRQFIRQHQFTAIAFPDNAGFVVELPHRQSFSPDAAYYEGPNSGMRFFAAAPKFAVEVRSENDYGPVAETEMAQKRADYFAAGTQVVWDVDLLSENVVRKYSASFPMLPEIFRRNDIANAEPAVPHWTMPVEDLFES
jgi:Uma2 family endonuclease